MLRKSLRFGDTIVCFSILFQVFKVVNKVIHKHDKYLIYFIIFQAMLTRQWRSQGCVRGGNLIKSSFIGFVIKILAYFDEWKPTQTPWPNNAPA